ncbi:CU044_2847 family protein [Baaleninema simplex]|uniref:CU044_2847 family protein n=1 Tax=Baaleninema simplex TaxID=2862350 RepID=UPI00034C2B1C|nr:CU044_2847 family protein [Baaleninema simplex]
MTDEVPLQKLVYEDEETGERYEIYIESKDAEPIDLDAIADEEDEDEDRPSRGGASASQEARDRMVKATEMMRGYAKFAVNSFRNFASANVSEVTIEFGLKFAGKAGVPLVTEGSAETTMKVQVKFQYPQNTQTPDNPKR